MHVIHRTRQPQIGPRLDNGGPLSLITKFCTIDWMYLINLNCSTFCQSCHLFLGAMNPHWNFRNWTAPQGQVDPSMWNSMASSVPQHPGMGGFVSGCDSTLHAAQQQQQVQSQAQIDFLRQQNLLLNQQIATQAASHIHQLHTLQSQSPPTTATPPPPSTAPSTPRTHN